MNNIKLNELIIANDNSHHLFNNKPIYAKRFLEVLKFHPPGLAAVLDETGAYHINLNGDAIYPQRYTRTFGFYDGCAAVIDKENWFHLSSCGEPLYSARYSWCGNFQEGICTVRDINGNYFHIDLSGEPLYEQKYSYVGDFKDGVAAIQNKEGLYTHIYVDGRCVHDQWFHDLDLFHKGFARAKDAKGWCHVDESGIQLYVERYKMIEPFYNGFARVEDDYGAILIIDEHGKVVRTLREQKQTSLQSLSADLVGYWKTQTIKAAVELNIFDFLPSNENSLATKSGLGQSGLRRLLRALCELDLIYKENDLLLLTKRGKLLQSNNEISLAAAAIHWAAEPYLAWQNLADALKTNDQIYSQKHGDMVFEWLDKDSNILQLYQKAMLPYAIHDYQDIAQKVGLSENNVVIDAAGGQGILLDYLLQEYSHLEGILLERPAVIQSAVKSNDAKKHFVSIGFDLFAKWPKVADAIFLSRVLHDWNDELSVMILKRAKEALLPNGSIYLIEMLLDENAGNGGMLDLNMLVLTGGLERTKEQFAALTKKVNLKIVNIAFLSCGNCVLKLEPERENK